MNAEESHPDDEAILPHLIACDEALAAGIPLQRPTDAETPKEWIPRLQEDLACIQALRQVLSPRATVNGPVPTPESPFQQLGRFLIRRQLGQGAFGMVFLADDPQLGREVALKVPRPEALLTGELRERFLREARAAAGLDHPNLVPVYEAGAVGPLCYIASTYCSGITLIDWLKERNQLPPVRLAATLVATLADAVAHAHSRGVIHRDLKPGNVLLQGTERDPEGARSTVKEPVGERESADADCNFIPRITDFGLAKLTIDAPGQRADAGDAETRSGAILGTPNYMAPEQASGKNKEIGPAADIYALGAILYELLTGQPPFRGETILETLEQVRSRDPLPPGRLRPKLARDLETISLKCLQKESCKRYESAAALADDLRRYIAGEPIQARPIRAWERGLKWARRKPSQAMLLIVSALASIALLAVVLIYNAQLQQRNQKLNEEVNAKEEQRQLANKNLHLASLAIENFATKLGQDKRLLAHNLEDLRTDYLQSAMDMWRQFLKQRPEDPDRQEEYARTLQRFGGLIREMGAKQEAIGSFQEAVVILRECVSSHSDVSRYQGVLADALN
jgi:serine/threonine protein kinase